MELSPAQQQQVLQAVEYFVATTDKAEIKNALAQKRRLLLSVEKYPRTDVDGLQIAVCEVQENSQQILQQLIYLAAEENLFIYDVEMDEMTPVSVVR